MTEQQKQQHPDHYDTPMTIRWYTTPGSSGGEFTSTDIKKLEEVYARLYQKYIDSKIASLEISQL